MKQATSKTLLALHYIPEEGILQIFACVCRSVLLEVISVKSAIKLVHLLLLWEVLKVIPCILVASPWYRPIRRGGTNMKHLLYPLDIPIFIFSREVCVVGPDHCITFWISNWIGDQTKKTGFGVRGEDMSSSAVLPKFVNSDLNLLWETLTSSKI
jgi:hypothetical protein